MSDKIEATKEDEIILYYKNNKPLTFTDIMEKFSVSEHYSKCFLDRIKSGSIKIEEENK